MLADVMLSAVRLIAIMLNVAAQKVQVTLKGIISKKQKYKKLIKSICKKRFFPTLIAISVVNIIKHYTLYY
jgi:hypothetical protein